MPRFQCARQFLMIDRASTLPAHPSSLTASLGFRVKEVLDLPSRPVVRGAAFIQVTGRATKTAPAVPAPRWAPTAGPTS